MINTNIFALLFLLLVGIAMLIPFALSLRRADEEKGKKAIYKDRCSARFGLFGGGANIPYWRLAFYDNFMVMAGIFKPRVIPYNTIKTIKYKGHWLFKGIYIELENNLLVSNIFIFPRESEKILHLVKEKMSKCV